METRKTMNVCDAAKVLGIGRLTCYAQIAEGKIPSLRLGKRIVVPIPALERMLQGRGMNQDGEEVRG